MRVEVKVPQLPESVAEATLVSWHKQPGDAVRRDENLIDVETDKVVLELPAPDGGVLVEIVRPNGATVASGEVIAVIDTAATAAAAPGRSRRRSRPPHPPPHGRRGGAPPRRRRRPRCPPRASCSPRPGSSRRRWRAPAAAGASPRAT